MASAKIEALKSELTVSLSRSIADREELLKAITKSIVVEVVGDLRRKADNLSSQYHYGSDAKAANDLEILVDACVDFVTFAKEVRSGKVLRLSSGGGILQEHDVVLDGAL